jgi:DNA-directed RNA polymerase subunit M/transcription elongation factor TFIIS
MNFGIKQLSKNIFCANCGRLITKQGEFDANYCFVCGNPLKAKAIEEKQQEVNEYEKNNMKKLLEISKDLNTDSLKKVIDEINK